uniref:Uncharacterized protein n=1 Tax=Odontella aurita TaxID=265563 RepID=A0A7S4JLF0_9STRA|mmetsp:Transcript_48766/g.146937  ORF Transcript_48766/g.146937 Transcript_48766/m.146937 type:complete len:162 (+) Transcript_48766:977-1462(+)
MTKLKPKYSSLFCFMSLPSTVVGISNSGGPIALAIAAGLCGIVQLAAAVTGTFVLKRFPTRFSVGFFLGLIVIISQQCLIAFVAFGGRHVEEDGRNSLVFANISLALFLVYGVFALMLVHFREHIVLAPIDVGTIARKGKGGEGDAGSLGEGASYDNFEER